jgi:hypothetical protein
MTTKLSRNSIVGTTFISKYLSGGVALITVFGWPRDPMTPVFDFESSQSHFRILKIKVKPNPIYVPLN